MTTGPTTREVSPERLGVHMADVAYVQTREKLVEALDMLDSLTDVTFLLVHLVMKGYRTDDQVTVTRFILEDAMALLKQHDRVPDGCAKCGSRDPEYSNWHASHCKLAT